MSPEIHIIMYHSIDDSGSVLSIAPSLFRSQLLAWEKGGANFLSVETLAAILRGGQPYPDGYNILITFDDGLESVYTQAYPILSEVGVPACVFLCTALMGKDNGWPGQPDWVPRMDIMTWEQAEEMARSGIEFESHLLDHPDLSTVTDAEARRQLSESKKDIEEHLGTTPRALAFPYGRSSPAILRWAAEDYELAFGTGMGVAHPEDDPMDLPRVDAYYLQSRRIYKRLNSTMARTYLAFRKTLRRLRGH